LTVCHFSAAALAAAAGALAMPAAAQAQFVIAWRLLRVFAASWVALHGQPDMISVRFLAALPVRASFENS
jgi:TRAP-type mannitol/chloroaromatic compound transport system substrate-binding protein